MWKKIEINTNQIKVTTARAMLVNCPHKSKYDGYSFWHPAKLIRDGRHSSALSLSYTDEFEFKLIKYSNKKFDTSVISEVPITVEEFEEMFEITCDNISASKIDTEHYLSVVEPQRIEIDAKIEDSLKNEKHS